MTTIEIKKKTYQVPATWNELSAAQLLNIFIALNNPNYKPEEQLLKLFKVVVGISSFTWAGLKVEDYEEYIYLTGFLFDKKINFTKQLLPVYENMYGPADDLENLLGSELVLTDHYYQQWEADRQNMDHLNHLVAVLYRPAKPKYDFALNPDGDCRVAFNENVTAWAADNIIASWPLHVKQAIAYWYAGCRQQIVDQYPDVFGGSGEPARYGMLSILRSIAKTGTHGTLEQVEKLPIGLIMIELDETVDEGKKMEEQMKKPQ